MDNEGDRALGIMPAVDSVWSHALIGVLIVLPCTYIKKGGNNDNRREEKQSKVYARHCRLQNLVIVRTPTSKTLE